MSEPATRPTEASVTAFLEAVDHPVRRADGLVLMSKFRDWTGFEPRMWGPSMVGFGRYSYEYKSGHSGEALATGFSPRKANMVVYVMPGLQTVAPLLEGLGPHKTGQSCLYLGPLAKVDLAVLERVVRAGLSELRERWPISD